jgi:aryl-alcohol dehydrogenase-like predicted oxidoreductase
MRKRKLGRTGYHVSELGFGAWGLGSAIWRGVDPRDAQRSLYRAVESGIDFVDTAPVYGDSEALVGGVIRDLRARDTVVVATKVAPLDRKWPADGSVDIAKVFPAQYVVASVEQSLRNQRAEVLSIVQLHVWNDAWLESAAWHDLRGTMSALIQAGKVLHWGISVNAHDPDSALGVLDDPLIETVQTVYNIFDRGAERALLGRARERDVGVIARVPFDEGALTGAFTHDTRFPVDDFRDRYFGGDRLAQVVERVDALRALCTSLRGEIDTMPELALRFCLSHPDVSTVIAGMRRIEHVEQNIAASERGALSAELCERLREHAWDKNWYGSDPE